jgi:hypothetical protein
MIVAGQDVYFALRDEIRLRCYQGSTGMIHEIRISGLLLKLDDSIPPDHVYVR